MKHNNDSEAETIGMLPPLTQWLKAGNYYVWTKGNGRPNGRYIVAVEAPPAHTLDWLGLDPYTLADCIVGHSFWNWRDRSWRSGCFVGRGWKSVGDGMTRIVHGEAWKSVRYAITERRALDTVAADEARYGS